MPYFTFLSFPISDSIFYLRQTHMAKYKTNFYVRTVPLRIHKIKTDDTISVMMFTD